VWVADPQAAVVKGWGDVLGLCGVEAVDHFSGHQSAGDRCERDGRVHDGDEAAGAAGQWPDDRQAVDRHRSRPDPSLDEPHVLGRR